MEKDTIRIPVRATYRIGSGAPVLIDAEYKEFPTEDVAQFFLRAFLAQRDSKKKGGKHG